MARLIEDKLKKKLAEALLFGGLEANGKVRVEVVSGEIALTFNNPSIESPSA